MQITLDSRVLLPQLGAAAALLTCLAVIFNVGGSGNAAKREMAEAKSEWSVAAISVGRSETPDVREPELVQAVGTSASMRSTIQPVSSFEGDGGAPAPAIPASDAGNAPAVPAHATMEGIWAPGTSCSLRTFRDGSLPTFISADGAWAGETMCIFKNQRQTDTGWSVIASCSNAREQWATRVNLGIKGDRLTWASKRGIQTYTRCSPDFLIAEVR